MALFEAFAEMVCKRPELYDCAASFGNGRGQSCVMIYVPCVSVEQAQRLYPALNASVKELAPEAWRARVEYNRRYTEACINAQEGK